jgi:hypothetical protein
MIEGSKSTMSITEIDRDPFAFAGYEGDGDAELFALIAEYRSLHQAGGKIRDELCRRKKELPPLRVAIVEIGKIIWPDGTFDPVLAENEDEITDKDHHGFDAILRVVLRPCALGVREPPFEMKIYKDRVDELLADFRAQAVKNKAAYDDARKAAEIGTLSDRAEELGEQAEAALDSIYPIHPATMRGVLAVLDLRSLIDDPDWWPDEAIEGLREIAAREARS